MAPSETPPDDRTERQRMLAGELYQADDPELSAGRARAAALMDRYNHGRLKNADERQRVLRDLLGELGSASEIRPPLYCDYGTQIRVGDRTFVNFGLVALDVAAIVIGDDVQIGPNVQLLAATHPVEAEARREKREAGQPITIGDNAWLGGGVIVLPGITIGENTVVGAGAVVTGDLPAGVVAVGNPARILRS